MMVPIHRPIASRLACSAILLFPALVARPIRAQQPGLAFWEPPKAADSLLDRSPHNDKGRYAALRQAFIDFHCTASLMQEQPVGTHGDSNLICTLPGETTDTVIVAARYDGRAGAGWQSTWIDAILLPMLDHALQAQPRHHTFVFAALCGPEGEAAFLTALHDAGKPQPHAMIVLDGLGFGSPFWYTRVAASGGSQPEDLGVNGLLGGVGAAICRFMKIPQPAPLTPARYLTNGGFAAAEFYRQQRFESSLVRSANTIPELLIYGDQPEAATQETVDPALPDIRRDLDYAAWVLCLADIKLDAAPLGARGAGPGTPPVPPSAPAPAPAAPASPLSGPLR